MSFAFVVSVHRDGGSLLRTSKNQITDSKQVDNCLRVLEMNRVRYLVVSLRAHHLHAATNNKVLD